MEAICLFAIAVVFLNFILPRRGSCRGGQLTAAASQIAILKEALETFKDGTGFYPTGAKGLETLVRRPIGITNWHGPYIQSIPKDPWGRDYLYECPGMHVALGYPYDLFSLGPQGGSFPIANWGYGVKP